MSELPEDHGAVGMHRATYACQTRNYCGIPSIHEALGHLAGRVHRWAFHDDKANSALCALFVVGTQIVRRHSVPGAESCEVRLEYEPTNHSDTAYGKAPKQVRKRSRCVYFGGLHCGASSLLLAR